MKKWKNFYPTAGGALGPGESPEATTNFDRCPNGLTQSNQQWKCFQLEQHGL
jgi:hypothetical protein